MEGHQQCKFPLVGSGGWTKVECSISGKLIRGGCWVWFRYGFARTCGKLVTQLVFPTQKLPSACSFGSVRSFFLLILVESTCVSCAICMPLTYSQI